MHIKWMRMDHRYRNIIIAILIIKRLLVILAQACGEWKGIRHLVVGDFAHLGHDQLLLLFKGELSKRLNYKNYDRYSNPDSVLDFLVTDLAQFNTTIKVTVK